MMRLVSKPDTLAFFQQAYANSSTGNVVIRYGDLKKQLGEDMVAFIKPIRGKTDALLQNKAYLNKIMHDGKEKARANAAVTIDLVRKAMGVNYY